LFIKPYQVLKLLNTLSIAKRLKN